LTAIVVIVLLSAISHNASALPQESPAPAATPEASATPTAQEQPKGQGNVILEGAEGPQEGPPPEGILKQIENTPPAKWIRESPSLFAFAGILLMHTVGMALVVGVNAGIDLRILGLARDLPLAPLAKFFPVLWFGFFINAFTGVLLLYADLSTKLINPDFWVKLVFIALALITLKRLRRSVFSDPQIDSKPLPADAKLLAFASLVFWIGAVTAGRLLAYVGNG
jgi:hypothetical protein